MNQREPFLRTTVIEGKASAAVIQHQLASISLAELPEGLDPDDLTEADLLALISF